MKLIHFILKQYALFRKDGIVMGNPLRLYKKYDTMTENMFDIICCFYAKSNKLLCYIVL